MKAVGNTKKKIKKDSGNKQWAGRNRARNRMIGKDGQILRGGGGKKNSVRQSEKVAERFCWSSSLLLSQLMLSCHLQELIGTSSVKTHACVLILTDALHTNTHACSRASSLGGEEKKSI